MILFFRIIVDLLWSYKIFTITISIVAFILAIQKILKYKFKKKEIPIYSTIVVFIILLTTALLKDFSSSSIVIWGKVFFSLTLFLLGVHNNSLYKDSKNIAKLSIIIVSLHFIMALLGIGYKHWGATNTFSGLYFFKTDLALSMVICLIYILYFFKPKRDIIKIVIVALTIYLVFISNARMHLLSSFLIVALYLIRRQVVTNPLRTFFIGAPILSFSFVAILTIIVLFVPKGFLTIDFDNFYSDSNMQGRNQIWDILLNQFYRSDIYDRIFGLGLNADVKINLLYGSSEEVYNAHNGFLYLLVSTGYTGLTLFLLLGYLFMKRFVRLTRPKTSSAHAETFLMTFLSFLLLFYISSLSTVSIIFQQQTWFFFFWCGVLYNSAYFAKKNYAIISDKRMDVTSERNLSIPHI
ncbi:O-antigen ligase [Dyadobacter sp. CY312]|uniref:O-antigen ligase family protein n=1 Tax=Dyadobacter sp. CY312 TaxID=2907303 RepID=UPI001F252575|nr:O-antigen ligase family protein [Dyadobacter sp. CY312]MCE7040499.1 O-antigen ligase family protein [Dyadobacter sp. CY312]